MERLYKMKNSNPDENVYIIGPMYLKNGLTTAVVVTLPKNTGKVNIVSFKEDEQCLRK